MTSKNRQGSIRPKYGWDCSWPSVCEQSSGHPASELFGLMDVFPFHGIPAVFPVRYASRIMPHVLKTVFNELVVNHHTRGTTGVRAVDDNFPFWIECLEKNLFEADRTGDPLFPKHPLVQTIDQRELASLFELLLQLVAIAYIYKTILTKGSLVCPGAPFQCILRKARPGPLRFWPQIKREIGHC